MNEKKIEARIKVIKSKIIKLQSIRPGSLSKQYNVCGTTGCKCKDEKNPQRHGPYFKLNYTQEGKSKTQFIRDQFAEEIEEQIINYKKFKELTKMWITLEIERSNLIMKTKNEETDEENRKSKVKLRT